MLKQIDDYVYSMKLEYLNPEGTAGEYTENNIKYIIDNSVPYGFEEADEFMIYVPGCPLDIIPEDFFFWTVTYVNKDEDKAMPEGIYGIYNVGGMCSFIGKKE